jgi:hypothetical protein
MLAGEDKFSIKPAASEVLCSIFRLYIRFLLVF